MSFKVGDEVISRKGIFGEVTSITDTSTWNGIAQPIAVKFNSYEFSTIEHFSPDGTYHPGTESILDIKKLTKLHKAMK